MSGPIRYISKHEREALKRGKELQRFLNVAWPPWDGVAQYQLAMERRRIMELHAVVYGELPREQTNRIDWERFVFTSPFKEEACV
jgi:hypothetical protein